MRIHKSNGIEFNYGNGFACSLACSFIQRAHQGVEGHMVNWGLNIDSASLCPYPPHTVVDSLLLEVPWTEPESQFRNYSRFFETLNNSPHRTKNISYTKTTLTTILSKLVNIKCDVKWKTMKVMSAVDLQVTLSYASAKTLWHFVQFCWCMFTRQ